MSANHDATSVHGAEVASIDALSQGLEGVGYFAERSLATSIFLAIRLRRPLFLEGEAGVGKTAVAKALAELLHGPLIRLQCYEGLDLSTAVYEWDYSRQMVHIRLLEASGQVDASSAHGQLFDRSFLLERPLLQAVTASRRDAAPPVLLIDELDRADEEFESFLLELLSDFQVTIPELGTLRAKHRPITLITSNRTREVHDALKRRCVYHWIDYPSHAKELDIVERKVPGLGTSLQGQVVRFVQRLRQEDLYKKPGIAETLDWAQALEHLAAKSLDVVTVQSTLGFLLKYQDDVDRLRSGLADSLVTEAMVS